MDVVDVDAEIDVIVVVVVIEDDVEVDDIVLDVVEDVVEVVIQVADDVITLNVTQYCGDCNCSLINLKKRDILYAKRAVKQLKIYSL